MPTPLSSVVASKKRARYVLCMASASGEESFSSSKWMESLRARQEELETQRYELDQKWRNADCASGPRVALPDWVRRMDVGEYPLVACGSASDTVFVASLKTGDVLAQSSVPKEDDEEMENMDETLRILYGKYDGGGTLAICMKRNLICSAGRCGGVQIWRYDATSPVLVSQGSMQALEGVMVTCLRLDDDLLWTADATGRVRAFCHNSPDVPLALQREPVLEWKFDSCVTCLDINQEAGCGVCTTASGKVELFSLEDDDGPLATWSPPLRRTDFCQCASIVPRNDGYAVVCGASDGTLHMQTLNWDESVDEECPFMGNADQCRPSHLAAVKCIACPSPDVLVTGGQDGSLRVWDFSGASPTCLYQFIGYKVWLGSLWTDGIRLVSDGSDNTIVVHDFEKEKESLD